MRLGVGIDLVAALLDLRHRVRGRGLDPVDLAAQQSGCAGIGFRHGQHHDLGDLGGALGVPVSLVGGQLQALARHKACHLERTRARRVSGERGPGGLAAVGRGRHAGGHGLELGVPLRGRGHEQVGQVGGQKRVGLAGGQFHRQVVNLAGAAQRGHAGRRHADLAGVELHRVLVQHLAHVPHHCVGVEGRAVMELHTGAQLEHPLGLVLGVHHPGHRHARNHHAGRVGLGQIPLRQRVINRDTSETVALEALVRLAQRAGNVRRRHGDAQGFVLRQQGGGRQGQRHGQRGRGNSGQT